MNKVMSIEMQRSWDYYFTEQSKIEQAKHLLNNCKKYIIHEINKLIVFKFNGYCQVINKESLNCKFFDTEKEALDYCLDVYPNTFEAKQVKLL